MAQYFDDYASHTLGSPPTGYTVGSGTAVIADVSGNYHFQYTGTSTVIRGTTIDAIDSDTNRNLSEIVVRVKGTTLPSSSQRFAGVLLRAQSAGSTSGYMIWLVRSGTGLLMLDIGNSGNVASTSNVLPNSLATGTYYYIRARVSNPGGGVYRIQAKAWEEGETEPGSWDLTYDDSSLTYSTGGVGMVIHNSVAQFDWNGIGTNGDAAPTGSGISGAIAVTHPAFSASAAASQIFAATAALAFTFAAAATAVEKFSGTTTATFPAFAASATASQTYVATGAASFNFAASGTAERGPVYGFLTDFSELATGSGIPSDAIRGFVQTQGSGGTFEIAEVGDATGGKVLRVDPNGMTVLTWKQTPGTTTIGEVVARYRYTTLPGSDNWGFGLLAHGVSVSAMGIYSRENSSGLEIAKTNNPLTFDKANAGSGNGTLATNTWYWQRLRVEYEGGSDYRFRAKAWHDSDPEPTSWGGSFLVTTTSTNDDGPFGLYFGNSNAVIEVDVLGAILDTGTAPQWFPVISTYGNIAVTFPNFQVFATSEPYHPAQVAVSFSFQAAASGFLGFQGTSAVTFPAFQASVTGLETFTATLAPAFNFAAAGTATQAGVHNATVSAVFNYSLFSTVNQTYYGWHTDFSEYTADAFPTGTFPRGWVRVLNPAVGTYLVKNVPEATGGKVLQITPGTQYPSTIGWPLGGADAKDGEIVVRYRYTTIGVPLGSGATQRLFGLVHHGVSEGKIGSYTAQYWDDSIFSSPFYLITEDTGIHQAGNGPRLLPNVWYWQRFRAEKISYTKVFALGAYRTSATYRFKAKIWQDGATEPDWMVDVTRGFLEVNPSGYEEIQGYMGLYAAPSNAVIQVDVVGIDTAQGSAPAFGPDLGYQSYGLTNFSFQTAIAAATSITNFNPAEIRVNFPNFRLESIGRGYAYFTDFGDVAHNTVLPSVVPWGTEATIDPQGHGWTQDFNPDYVPDFITHPTPENSSWVVVDQPAATGGKVVRFLPQGLPVGDGFGEPAGYGILTSLSWNRSQIGATSGEMVVRYRYTAANPIHEAYGFPPNLRLPFSVTGNPSRGIGLWIHTSTGRRFYVLQQQAQTVGSWAFNSLPNPVPDHNFYVDGPGGIVIGMPGTGVRTYMKGVKFKIHSNTIHEPLPSLPADDITDLVDDSWYWQRFRQDDLGGNLYLFRAKLWKDGDAEPDWQLTLEYQSDFAEVIQFLGIAGDFRGSTETTVAEVDIFGIGLEGAAAPTPFTPVEFYVANVAVSYPRFVAASTAENDPSAFRFYTDFSEFLTNQTFISGGILPTSLPNSPRRWVISPVFGGDVNGIAIRERGDATGGKVLEVYRDKYEVEGTTYWSAGARILWDLAPDDTDIGEVAMRFRYTQLPAQGASGIGIAKPQAESRHVRPLFTATRLDKFGNFWFDGILKYLHAEDSVFTQSDYTWFADASYPSYPPQDQVQETEQLILNSMQLNVWYWMKLRLEDTGTTHPNYGTVYRWKVKVWKESEVEPDWQILHENAALGHDTEFGRFGFWAANAEQGAWRVEIDRYGMALDSGAAPTIGATAAAYGAVVASSFRFVGTSTAFNATTGVIVASAAVSFPAWTSSGEANTNVLAFNADASTTFPRFSLGAVADNDSALSFFADVAATFNFAAAGFGAIGTGASLVPSGARVVKATQKLNRTAKATPKNRVAKTG